MTTPVDLSVGLLRRFADFTKKLSPEQLEALVAGHLKFGLLEPPVPKTMHLPFNVDDLRAELEAMPTRDAAAARLDGLKLSGDLIKELAKALGAPISGVRAKTAIRDRIVEHIVGFRLNSQTIRHGSWSAQQ